MKQKLTLDHLAIRVRDIEETVAFYEAATGRLDEAATDGEAWPAHLRRRFQPL